MHDTVDPDPAVALAVELVEEINELALAGPHDRGGQHLEPQTLVHREHLVDDLLRGSAGRCAHRRPGSAGGCLPGRREDAGSRRLGDGADG